MPQRLNLLTDRRIRAIKEPGRYTDGGGLVLQCGPSGAKSWLFVWKRSGRRTVMGLGGIASVSLAEARQKALACRKAVAEGCNPLTERRSKEEIPTFSETVASFLDDHRLAGWRNAKHREQWKMTLGPAYCRAILDLKVDEIKTADIVAVLRPIWATKSETASRLRGRIERVLAFAEVRGWRPQTKNPAQWRGHLDAILPPARKLTARGHHVAMAYRDVPAFIHQLDAAPGMAALCLKFLTLTAARSGEAIAARWDEIDMEKRIWTVPGSRMKAGNEHRVPLSDGALEVLKVLEPLRQGEFIFHGRDTAKPLSAGALEMLMRRLKVKFATTGGPTVHGFRSAFRDWVGDCTSFPREIAEAALAHRVGDAVERAYRRSDALDRRRSLMVAWDEFCRGGEEEKVVDLPPENKDNSELRKLDQGELSDWKLKHETVARPERKLGDANPILRETIERTLDTFGLEPAPSQVPRERLERKLAELPRSKADELRNVIDECLAPRRRGQPPRGEHHSFRIAREVADRIIAAPPKSQEALTKVIYGEVADRHALSPTTVRDFYLRHRDLAELLAKGP